MSIFIRSYGGEIFESKKRVQQIKKRIVEISGKTRDYFKDLEVYQKNLDRATELLTNIESSFFKLKTLLPNVPENVVPKLKFLKKGIVQPKTKDNEKIDSESELERLKGIIEDI